MEECALLFDRCARTSSTKEEELEANSWFPAYSTWMMSRPRGKLDVLSVAFPRRRGTVSRTVVPSRKAMSPMGCPPERLRFVTVAVKVTDFPNVAGFGFAVRTALVR